jgi:hypothetical protein
VLSNEEIVPSSQTYRGFEVREKLPPPEDSISVASDPQSLLAGLHSLKAGRRLRVRLAGEEERLLSVVSAAKLPLWEGPAWYRVSYPGLGVGPWTFGESEGPVYLIDIGNPDTDLNSSPTPRTVQTGWRRVNYKRETPSLLYDHFSYDGKWTLCNREITTDWGQFSNERPICWSCEYRFEGDQVQRGYAGDPSRIEVSDEIEFMNESSLGGDPRLWLDKPPDGYPYRLASVVGPSPETTRNAHRSEGAVHYRIQFGKSILRQANERSADWAEDNRWALTQANNLHVRKPISIVEATPPPKTVVIPASLFVVKLKVRPLGSGIEVEVVDLDRSSKIQSARTFAQAIVFLRSGLLSQKMEVEIFGSSGHFTMVTTRTLSEILTYLSGEA